MMPLTCVHLPHISGGNNQSDTLSIAVAPEDSSESCTKVVPCEHYTYSPGERLQQKFMLIGSIVLTGIIWGTTGYVVGHYVYPPSNKYLV